MAQEQQNFTSWLPASSSSSTSSSSSSPTREPKLKPSFDQISTDDKRLLTIEEVPDWQKDGNCYIETSYRPPTQSSKRCLQSVCQLHNETINIHSHLIGAILFFLLTIIVPTYVLLKFGQPTTAEYLVWTSFLLGVGICFATSAVCHTLNNHSPGVACTTLTLDLQGIVLLMWGATMPTVHYTFLCSRKLQTIYWTLISVLALICATTTFMTSSLRNFPLIQPLRATLYSMFGLSTLVPVFHGIALYGIKIQNERSNLCFLLATALLNLTGSVAYAARVPEKYFRKRFDLVGSSHQIMHVMVLLAAIAHLVGQLRNFQNFHSKGAMC